MVGPGVSAELFAGIVVALEQRLLAARRALIGSGCLVAASRVIRREVRRFLPELRGGEGDIVVRREVELRLLRDSLLLARQLLQGRRCKERGEIIHIE